MTAGELIRGRLAKSSLRCFWLAVILAATAACGKASSAAEPGAATTTNAKQDGAGAAPSARPSGTGFPRCPARYSNQQPPGVGGGGPLVAEGAIAVVDCSYGYPVTVGGRKQPVATPLAGPRVRGGRAVAGYALVLNEAPLASPGQAACMRAQAVSGRFPRDLLLFGYPGGRVVRVDWSISCWLAGRSWGSVALRTRGPAVALDPLATDTLASLLDSVSGPSARGRGTRPTPSLVGLAMPAAVAAAAREGITLSVDAELLDRGAPLGVIELQTPPPGARGNPGIPVSVILAVSDQPACTASQLRATAASGVPGAGTSFAAITLRDTGAHPCSLRGPLQVVATTAAGQALAVPNAVPVAQPLVLSGQAPPPPHPATPATLSASILLSSTDYAGNCTGTLTYPRAWRVSFPDGSELIAPVSTSHSTGPPIIVCDHRVGVGPVAFTGWQAPFPS